MIVKSQKNVIYYSKLTGTATHIMSFINDQVILKLTYKFVYKGRWQGKEDTNITKCRSSYLYPND